MFDQYSAICGISKTELTTVMKPDVEALGKALGVSYEECLEELRQYYDGYHFSEHSEDVFNPFSLIRLCLDRRLVPTGLVPVRQAISSRVCRNIMLT